MFRFKWRWGLLAIIIAALFLGSNTVSPQTTAKASVSPAVMQEQLAIGIDVNGISGDTQVARGRIAGSYETFVAGISNDQTSTTATIASVGNTVGLSRSSPVAASGSGSVYNRLRDMRLAWEVRRFNNELVFNVGQCGPPLGYANRFATMIASTAHGDFVDFGSDNVGPWTTTGSPDTNMATDSARLLAWLGGFSDYGGGVAQVGDGNTIANSKMALAGTGTTFNGASATT